MLSSNEIIQWLQKRNGKPTRSKPQDALAGVSDDYNLLASGVDTSAVCATQSAMNMGSR